MAQRTHRRRASLLFAAGMLALATMGAAAAHAAGENLLLFRPHCEKEDQKQCPFYTVEDPTSLGTPELKVGDVLDLDIVLINAGKVPLKRVRTWLSYDTQILEATSVTLNRGLPIQLPGEAEADTALGYVKIGASSETGAEPKDEVFPVARVQFTVKAVPAGNKLPLAFYDLTADTTGHTVVTSAQGPDAVNILAAPTASLIVHITGSPSAATASSVASSAATVTSAASSSAPAASSASSKPSSSAPVVTAFPLLQIQNVRIGTEGSTLYLTWDALNSSALKSYNVYYGTTMGRYIQRRTVTGTTTGVVIKNLPEGTPYYAAIRGVNEQGQETAFSKEVAVQVGNPNSSTSQLLIRPQEQSPNTADLTAPSNPVQTPQSPAEVPGSSGLPSPLILLVIVSAVSGTLIALRRQFVALPSAHE